MTGALRMTIHTLCNRIRSSRALQVLLLLAFPALTLSFLWGGLLWAVLVFGYLKLLWSAAGQQEIVEAQPVQRAVLFVSGLLKMLFFTLLLSGSVSLIPVMAGCQVLLCCLSEQGYQSGSDMSPIPVLCGAGFTAALCMGAPNLFALLALLLTLFWLLSRYRSVMRELAMRLHTA